MLCSLHQVELARSFADRIVALRGGEVVFDGAPEAFDASSERAVYDGGVDRPAPVPAAPPRTPSLALEVA